MDNFDTQVQDNGNVLLLHYGSPVFRIIKKGDRFSAYQIGDPQRWVMDGQDVDDIIKTCKQMTDEH